MKSIIPCMAAAALLLVGCGKNNAQVEQDPAPAPVDPAQATALAAVVGQSVPEAEQMAIPAIKPTAEVGQSITLEGKVMGTAEPFVNNRAVMIIGDEKTITSCDLIPEDECETPWDVCCDDPDTIQAGTATIQVVGEDGKPLQTGLKGVSGLTELSRVRVSGIVAEGSTPELLIVNAGAIEVR